MNQQQSKSEYNHHGTEVSTVKENEELEKKETKKNILPSVYVEEGNEEDTSIHNRSKS